MVVEGNERGDEREGKTRPVWPAGIERRSPYSRVNKKSEMVKRGGEVERELGGGVRRV